MFSRFLRKKQPPKQEVLVPLQLSKPTTLFESKVFKILTNDHVVVIAGGGEETLDGKPAHLSKLNGPFGIFVSERNEVFITEMEGNRIRKIDKYGNIYSIAGTGKEFNFQAPGNEDGDALNCNIFRPTGIIVTEMDQIIFVDSGSMIRMITPDGYIKTLLSKISFTQNICQDENGVIFFNSEPTIISKLLPNGNLENISRKVEETTWYTDIHYHQIFDVKTRSGIVYYSERLYLRSFDKNGNDRILANLKKHVKLIEDCKKVREYDSISIFPSKNGTVYLADVVRGTLWIQYNQSIQKELKVKGEIPFSIIDSPHIGPTSKRIVRCMKLSDISIHTNK